MKIKKEWKGTDKKKIENGEKERGNDNEEWNGGEARR